jgi:benzoate membrane transport protein
MNLLRNWLSPVTAGFVAVLVGFTSSAVIVFQAAAAVGATPAQTSSWIFALCLGMALTSIILSWRYRIPVLTAWSTPGAALLATGLSGVAMSDAIGAFVVCGLLITVVGVTGWFERLIDKIPKSIASAMLAGVLLRFGIDVFASAGAQTTLVGLMVLAFVVCKLLTPRYAVPLVLLIGVLFAWWRDLLHFESVHLALTQPVWQTPSFSPSVLLGVAVPLFLVTMASQNVPGIATLHASGYSKAPVSSLITWTGVATVVLAPFGAFALNLAAITAAICMSPEAHPDAAQRYRAAIAAGVFYLLTGVLGATVVALLAAFPVELVKALAGLALVGTIGNALNVALGNEHERDAALLTFLCAASGLTLWGVGAAFWALLVGSIAMLLRWYWFQRRRPSDSL